MDTMDDISYTALCSAVTLQSNKNGFFQQIADSVTDSVDNHWLHDFGTLKSNKLRIVKCLTDKKIKDQVYQMMDNVQQIFRTKSALMSRVRRQEAEHLCEIGKFDKALLSYTQSVVRAPIVDADKSVDDGLSLALALWGRSTIFYQLGKMNFCLEDVKLCLNEKLPENLKLDAYWRMAECYIHLKQFDHARITLNILLKMTQLKNGTEPSDTWREKIQAKLNELLVQISNDKKLEIKTDQLLQVTGKPHSSLQNASSKLKLAQNNKAGKYLIADGHINTGDTLIVEDPYVSCLSNEKYGSHCQHCLRRLKTAIPCTQCSGIAFCSLACRTTALSTYHKFECRYLDLLIGSGMSVLSFAALRIVSQQTVKYFVDADLENRDGNANNPYKNIYNMIRHDDKRAPVDYFHRTLMALFLLAVLKKSGYFLNSKKMDDIDSQEMHIACILLRNLEVLQFNAHEIAEVIKCKKSKSLKTFNIGIGLYRTASYFNHDCYPAVSRYFVGTKLIIKAVRPVSANELVGDNYGPVFTKIRRADRRGKLLSRYWFECECKACTEDWPLIEELKDAPLKIRCTSCSNVLLKRNTETACLLTCKCKKSIDCSWLIEQIEQLHVSAESCVDDLDGSTISEMCTRLDSVNEILCPPHMIYIQVGHKLMQFSMNSGIVHTV